MGIVGDYRTGKRDFRGASLSGADLIGANLIGADLSGANLIGADLRGANLTGANLSDANLRGADLSVASLSGADLIGANLIGADLSGANLIGADLSGADLSVANLSGANLSGADLTGAIGYNPDRWETLRQIRKQPGAIRAFKVVGPNWEGVEYGGIPHKVGLDVFVDPGDCQADEHVQCGAGLNIATLVWCCNRWQSGHGFHLIEVEHTAEDIVAIPLGTDGKYRVRRLRVVGEIDVTTLGLKP